MKLKNPNIKLSLVYRATVFILSVAAILISLYLVNHFYSSHYPKSINYDSFCNVSDFFNCDLATFSHLAKLFEIPTGVFGLIFGVTIALFAFSPSIRVHQANYMLVAVNLLGCLLLFGYSVIILKGLCPGCAIYYTISIALFFIYFIKFRTRFILNPKMLRAHIIIAIIISGSYYCVTKKHDVKFRDLSYKLKTSFDEADSLEHLKLKSPIVISSNRSNYGETPIKLQVFTDFECGLCKVFSKKILSPLSKIFKDKITIEYFLFPLDSSCNTQVPTKMHPSACLASKYAICRQNDFVSAHDELFENHKGLNLYLEKKLGDKLLKQCIASPITDATLQEMIDSGSKLGITGTPTLILNNKLIGSGLPLKYYVLLVKHALGVN